MKINTSGAAEPKEISQFRIFSLLLKKSYQSVAHGLTYCQKIDMKSTTKAVIMTTAIAVASHGLEFGSEE